jgi:hydroxyethylthiazole kinase-like sugar kinase family protein
LRNIRLIYKILKTLDDFSGVAEFDSDLLSPRALDATKGEIDAVLLMLAEDGSIRGIDIREYVSGQCIVNEGRLRVTAYGLEYLHSSPMMQRMADEAKGIMRRIP